MTEPKELIRTRRRRPRLGIVTLIPTTSDTGNFQSHMEARPHEPIAAISDFKGKLLRFITRTVNMTVPG
jgi:hypothetical protein